ncbi:MAG: hypothetical protein OQK46_04940 [Gammaproteobacteria bacterium]|nr:hypothetical protein [Gammaproteobacteria bacterium]
MNKNYSFNKLLLKIVVISFTSSAFLSCAYTQQDDDKFDDRKLTRCVSPKPEVCTNEYAPVCGFEADGNHRTFSNACTACSDAEVNSYDEGACK